MGKVLVTGSAGAVGRPVCRELQARGHQVRGLDLEPTPGVDDFAIGDIADAACVDDAMRGCDTVVHLAANPADPPFPELVGPNVMGLFNVMNAARQAEVRRVVLASSIQVLWSKEPRTRPARVDDASPGNHYGLTKLWAEQMGAMYANRFGLSVVAVRIGWMVRNPREAQLMYRYQLYDMFLSARDAGRFFALAVEAEDVGFAVVYAVGLDGHQRYDMEPARRVLGYEPRDRWPEGLDFELPEPEASA